MWSFNYQGKQIHNIYGIKDILISKFQNMEYLLIIFSFFQYILLSSNNLSMSRKIIFHINHIRLLAQLECNCKVRTSNLLLLQISIDKKGLEVYASNILVFSTFAFHLSNSLFFYDLVPLIPFLVIFLNYYINIHFYTFVYSIIFKI